MTVKLLFYNGLQRHLRQGITCIITTSQFHRLSQEKKETPTLSSYRGSGEIEENTDLGLLMVYPYQQASFEKQKQILAEGKENIINLAVQKNRPHGLRGPIRLEFNPKSMRIKEWQ